MTDYAPIIKREYLHILRRLFQYHVIELFAIFLKEISIE